MVVNLLLLPFLYLYNPEPVYFYASLKCYPSCEESYIDNRVYKL